MSGRTTGMRLMLFHTTSMTIILVALGRRNVYTSQFLVPPQCYSTFSGSMRLSFSWNLNYYYHEYHGIINSFHVLVQVHVFGRLSYSL